MTKIFISHSSTDNDFARQLAQALTDVGIDIWIDLASIPAGMKWNNAIQQGLKECEAMIVILSPEAMASENVGDEWLYYHRREKRIFTVLWQPTEVHYQLEPIQYVDFHSREFNTAFRHLSEELKRSGIGINGADGELHIIQPDYHLTSLRIEDILPPPFEWCDIPSGIAVLKDVSEYGGTHGAISSCGPFKIAKYPITNAQYLAFIESEDGYRNTYWWRFSKHAIKWREDKDLPPKTFSEAPDIPRTMVSWYDAIAFCRWLSEKTSLDITLPTETEWQVAAVGDNEWLFPWGNEFDMTRGNFFKSIHIPAFQDNVMEYPQGASVYGVMNMIGNVGEWCLNEWGSDSDFGLLYTKADRIVKGGQVAALAVGPHSVSSKINDRYAMNPDRTSHDTGFRIVLHT